MDPYEEQLRWVTERYNGIQNDIDRLNKRAELPVGRSGVGYPPLNVAYDAVEIDVYRKYIDLRNSCDEKGWVLKYESSQYSATMREWQSIAERRVQHHNVLEDIKKATRYRYVLPSSYNYDRC